MRFHPLVLATGTSLLLLLIIASQAGKNGRIGMFVPDTTFSSDKTSVWKPPAYGFRSVGCCVDEVKSATWDGVRFELITAGSKIPLDLGEGPAIPTRYIPGGPDVLAMAHLDTHVWVPETKHQRLLEITSAGDFDPELGSNAVGPVNGVAVECANPVTLLMTTGPRSGTDRFVLEQTPQAGKDTPKLYVSRTGPLPPKLVQLTLGQNPVPLPLDIGDDLYAPTGISLTSDGRTAFVADEHDDELAWIKLTRTGNWDSPWLSKGKLVRFRLEEGQRRLFRGLIVLNYGNREVLAGAAPNGLDFYQADGRHLGTIETGEQITHVLIGHRKGRALLYVVAGKNVWEAVLNGVETRETAQSCDIAPNHS